MPKDSSRPSAAMEGKGSYNRHSLIPSGGGALALPHLKGAVAEASLDPFDRPIVIADYGSSQGRNSLAPIRSAIDGIRTRVGPDRPILVYHADQPSNDFNSLFELLDASPDRYSRDDPNIFPCAIGRSFYEQVLPPNSVHVGWSSYAAMWVRRVPAPIPGHFFFARSTGKVRAAWEDQGVRDWESFLAVRARELQPGGCLVVSVPGADENGASAFEGIMDHANAELAAMVDEGAITAEERSRMALNVWPRRRTDLIAPFAKEGRFQSLILKESETCLLRDPAWEAYEADQDTEALATKHAMFFRSVFTPTLASYLDKARAGDPSGSPAFGDRLTGGLRRRLAASPAPIHSLVQIVVAAKSQN
jgi:S-adenosylmethionine-dependent carboxyl methyltransferase